jgi:hypothetical protein
MNKFSDSFVYVQMKSFVSISLILLILSANLDLKIASHYCGGSLVASKLSFSGKPATCGMETDNETPPSGQNTYSNHCCDNKIALLSVSNFYDISSCNLKFTGCKFFQFANTEFTHPVENSYYKYPSPVIVRPPGVSLPDRDSCPVLCIFRI